MRMRIKVVAQYGFNWEAANKYALLFDCLPVSRFDDEIFNMSNTYYLVWANPELLSPEWLDNINLRLPQTSSVGLMPCANEEEADFALTKAMETAEGHGFLVYSTMIEESDTNNDKDCMILSSKKNEIPIYSRTGGGRWNLFVLSAHGCSTHIYLETAVARSIFDSSSNKDTKDKCVSEEQISDTQFDVSQINSNVILFDVCQSLRFSGGPVSFKDTLAHSAFFKNSCNHLIASVLSKDSGYPELAFCVTVLNADLEFGYAVTLINSGQRFFFGNRQSFFLIGNPLSKINTQPNQELSSGLSIELKVQGECEILINPSTKIGFGMIKKQVKNEDWASVFSSTGWKRYTISKVSSFKHFYIWVWGDVSERTLQFFFWFDALEQAFHAEQLAIIRFNKSVEKEYSNDNKLIKLFRQYSYLKLTIDNVLPLSQNEEIVSWMEKYELFLSNIKRFKYSHDFSVMDYSISDALFKKIREIQLETMDCILTALEEQLLQKWHAIIFNEDGAIPNPMVKTKMKCPHCLCGLIKKEFVPFHAPWSSFTRLECPRCGIIEEYMGDRVFIVSQVNASEKNIILKIENTTGELREFRGIVFCGNVNILNKIASWNGDLIHCLDKVIELEKFNLINEMQNIIFVLLTEGKLSFHRILLPSVHKRINQLK